jgi:hypothetical protein
MDNKFIKLTFDDTSISKKTVENRTIVSVWSGFKFTKLEAELENLGLKTLPEPIATILTKYGYKRDFKKNIWKAKSTGVATLSPDDENNDVTGYRIAMSRAKRKAYIKATNCLREISGIFDEVSDLFYFSSYRLGQFEIEETEAIEDVIDHGYSGGKK